MKQVSAAVAFDLANEIDTLIRTAERGDPWAKVRLYRHPHRVACSLDHAPALEAAARLEAEELTGLHRAWFWLSVEIERARMAS